jgi:hypothetical protein
MTIDAFFFPAVARPFLFHTANMPKHWDTYTSSGLLGNRTFVRFTQRVLPWGEIATKTIIGALCKPPGIDAHEIVDILCQAKS